MKITSWIVVAALSVVGVGLVAFAFQRPQAQASVMAESRTGDDAALSVRITGILGAKGTVMAAVCDEATFLKHCSYNQVARVDASGAALLKFDHVPPGAYALMAFHDENDNGQFDKTASGMPMEGYGFSRDARGHFGPPGFDDAKIVLKPGTQDISIELSY